MWPMGTVISIVRSSRPMPPASLELVDDFEPDHGEMARWAFETFIREDGPLYNPRHAHLTEKTIGWLWTTAENRDRNRQVAGTAQLIRPPQAKWGSARAAWQLRRWFPGRPLDALITLNANFCAEADDMAFCALVEHELCHLGHDCDGFGMPRFDQEGHPVLCMVAHDVEQFTIVVERYGAVAADVDAMVRVANAGPTIGQSQMTLACGSCGLRAA